MVQRETFDEDGKPLKDYDKFMDERHNFILESEAVGPIVPTT